jgi:hypothetical protein
MTTCQKLLKNIEQRETASPEVLSKHIVLNSIESYTAELLRLLPSLSQACKFGLHKGKPACADWIAGRCQQLAEALDTYNSDSFTLDDLQDR